MSVCRASDIPDLPGSTWLVTAWTLAGLLGLVLYSVGRVRPSDGHSPASSARATAWRAAGVALMSVPAWMVLLSTAPDMVRTFCAQGDIRSVLPGVPAGPPSAAQFLSAAVNGLERNVAYPLVGLLLWLHGRRLATPAGTTWTSWSEAVRPLVPVGKGLVPSTLLGIAAFPVLAAANLLLSWLTALDVTTGTAVPYYANMTLVSAIALAVAAGLGEELVYRGVMQQGLKRAFRGIGIPGGTATVLAVALQAIPFAYAHAGYGDATLLLFNVAFAVLAGVVAERYGIAAAIALHVLVDFYAFAMAAADALLWLAAGLVGIGIFAACVHQVRSALAARASKSRPGRA